jgi:octaprenyl-diphosphate synthase
MQLVSRFGGLQALTVFCRATMAIVDGEFRQLRNAAGFEQSETDYFTVVKGKTALLIGAACEIGGMYGAGDEGVCSGLQTFGINLGCGFQIIDDLLDYMGDADKTGKATGNDLAEGKMTLPVIIALQRADEQDRQALLSIFADPEKRARSLENVSELVERYQGFSAAREKAEELVDKAMAALPLIESQGSLKERAILKDLCTYVLNRDN